jgi:hypothetical protein
MLLSTPLRTDALLLSSTAPTAVAPGTVVPVRLEVAAVEACELLELRWTIPAHLGPSTPPSLPTALAAQEARTFDLSFPTAVGADGGGLIEGALRLRRTGGSESTLTWSAWISVYSRERADDPKRLSDAHRQRFLDTVNARRRNVDIFLANYGAFFDDFLNLELDPAIAASLSQEFGLPVEGLPLDSERRLDVILGRLSFYGIEDAKFLPEEECSEADDRFDARNAREVQNPDVA